MKLNERRRRLLLVGIGFLAGIIWFVLLRMATYTPENTHYHANFAVYIDDNRESFDSFVYYEEVTQCSVDGSDPSRRAHMHDYVNDVVHVHDQETTWGHFFANLGWTLGDKVLATRNEVYESPVYHLNGQPISTIANQVIKSEDVLLIDVNGAEAKVQEKLDSIQASAAEYNTQADPSACSGDEDSSMTARLKGALGIN